MGVVGEELASTATEVLDFSLIKNLKLTERQELRFTIDFFNI